MPQLILIILGVAVGAGVLLGVYLVRHSSVEKLRRGEARRGEVKDKALGPAQGKRGVVKERSAAKEENVERVRTLARERGRITNDDVERALGVSDATSTRYLEELEKEGVLRQVGAEGRHVYYEPR